MSAISGSWLTESGKLEQRGNPRNHECKVWVPGPTPLGALVGISSLSPTPDLLHQSLPSTRSQLIHTTSKFKKVDLAQALLIENGLDQGVEGPDIRASLALIN